MYVRSPSTKSSKLLEALSPSLEPSSASNGQRKVSTSSDKLDSRAVNPGVGDASERGEMGAGLWTRRGSENPGLLNSSTSEHVRRLHDSYGLIQGLGA